MAGDPMKSRMTSGLVERDTDSLEEEERKTERH